MHKWPGISTKPRTSPRNVVRDCLHTRFTRVIVIGPDGTVSPEGRRRTSCPVDRPASRMESSGRKVALEVSVTPRGRMSPELAGEFACRGLDCLVPLGADSPERAIEAAVAALDALSRRRRSESAIAAKTVWPSRQVAVSRVAT